MFALVETGKELLYIYIIQSDSLVLYVYLYTFICTDGFYNNTSLIRTIFQSIHNQIGKNNFAFSVIIRDRLYTVVKVVYNFNFFGFRCSLKCFCHFLYPLVQRMRRDV